MGGPLGDPEPDWLRCQGSAGAPGPPHTAECVLCPLSLPRPDPQFIAQRTAPLRGELLTGCDCVCLKAWLRRQKSTKFCSVKTHVLNAVVVSPGHGQFCPGKGRAGGAGAAICAPSCFAATSCFVLGIARGCSARCLDDLLLCLALLRNRAAACRWEAAGKRWSLPLETLTYFTGRVIGTENRQRFSCPQKERLQETLGF